MLCAKKNLIYRNDLFPIREEVTEIYKDFSKAIPANKLLVGNIEHEYELFKCKEYIESLILPYSDSYDKHFDYFDTFKTEEFKNKKMNLKLDKIWVNFQKKYEFNPAHTHRGKLSFVIWLDIPYDITMNKDWVIALDEALKITRDDVANELGGLPAIKMHCSNLAADALHEAIKDYRNKQKR